MSTAQPRLKREGKRSREIFERAEKVLVGGVNSPVRAFRSVGGEPLIIERGSGQHLYDADGNQLLDYVCSWGAMLLGHAHPAVSAAIAEQARRGTSFGVTTGLELELATLITRAIPFIEKIRFVSSGTEATISAVRLARGVTKRDFIVKFVGCYLGHADSFLSQAGSGLRQETIRVSVITALEFDDKVSLRHSSRQPHSAHRCFRAAGDKTNLFNERNLPCNQRGKRSEEHTSELQSRLHLVCRLLLEK